MPRADLLALTPDDLATLTNRGTVKRAQKELEAGEVTCECHEEPTGDLIFAWSDGIKCRFLAGKTVHDAVCSSGLSGISRHVIRSVLAYQQLNAGSAAPPTVSVTENDHPAESIAAPADNSPPPSAPHNSVWDPGSITDDQLIEHFRKPAISQARKRFEQGVLVELTRGTKPITRFLDEGCTVRFLVPGDLRYVSADCAESMLPKWVPLAVWAFRELPADRLAGLLCLQQAELPIPTAVLDHLSMLLNELSQSGMSGLADNWLARLARVEATLRDEGLVWPAELVVELTHQCEMYRQHDARFEPQQIVQLVGELTARTRAISNGTRAVPQPLIRGTKSDRPSEIAGGRMIGVGLGVRPGKRHTTISAYLQDVDSGSVVAVERTFADPDPKSGDAPRSFADLADTVLVRGVSLANIARSQLLLKTGKRTPSGQLILPRTAGSLTTHPQSFQWEQLKPPFAAESFAQLAARFEALPHACLRPRRRTENLHVVAVTGVDEVRFDVAHQKLTARLRDGQGDFAELVHPFHSRGSAGFNDLFATLEQRGQQVRYVCGHVRFFGRVLELQPISLILDDGQNRIGIHPWLPHNMQTTDASKKISEDSAGEEHVAESPVEEFLQRIDDLLADLLLMGLSQTSAAGWREILELSRRLGFVQLPLPIAAFVDALHARDNRLDWDASSAARHAIQLCLLSRMARD